MLVQLSAASSLFRPCVSNIFRALLLEAMFEPDHFSTCIEHSTSINLSTILKSHTKRALQSPGAHWFKLVWQAGKLASHRLVLRSERLWKKTLKESRASVDKEHQITSRNIKEHQGTFHHFIIFQCIYFNVYIHLIFVDFCWLPQMGKLKIYPQLWCPKEAFPRNSNMLWLRAVRKSLENMLATFMENMADILQILQSELRLCRGFVGFVWWFLDHFGRRSSLSWGAEPNTTILAWQDEHRWTSMNYWPTGDPSSLKLTR